MSNSQSTKNRNIGIDIGGVVRDLATGEIMNTNTREIISTILRLGHSVHFISKCKPAMEITLIEWLKGADLDHIPIVFCREYADKLSICNNLNIDTMIDDKMQVLNLFPPKIRKLWFCTEWAKISGTKTYHPEFFDSVELVQNWDELLEQVERE